MGRLDDISVTAGGGPPQPTLSDRATATEGDAGAVTARALVRLSSPAVPGGMTFDVATADGTARQAEADYLPLSINGRPIAGGPARRRSTCASSATR